MNEMNILDIVSNVGGFGIMAYLFLYMFRFWLPKERETHNKEMHAAREQYSESLDSQRKDFLGELKASRENMNVQIQEFTKGVSEQRQDFRKTLQILVPDRRED
jgi:hypothetical protein